LYKQFCLEYDVSVVVGFFTSEFLLDKRLY